jgi:hypothetical protein
MRGKGLEIHLIDGNYGCFVTYALSILRDSDGLEVAAVRGVLISISND